MVRLARTRWPTIPFHQGGDFPDRFGRAATGSASDDILHARERKLAAKKPMVISMSEPGGLGRILHRHDRRPRHRLSEHAHRLDRRVFRPKPNLRPLFDKLGVNTTTLKTGKFADIDSADHPLNDEEKAKLRREIEGFLSGVRRARLGRAQATLRSDPKAWRRAACGWARQAKQNGWWTNWVVSTEPSRW